MSFLWSAEKSPKSDGEKSPVAKKPKDSFEKESGNNEEVAQSENKADDKVAATKKSDIDAKKATKRPIESNLSEEETESKKSKSVQAERNEIACSLSSSTVKKRQADFTNDDSDVEQGQGVKKLKKDMVGSCSKSPLKNLKFESELSPRNMLKHLQTSVAKKESTDDSDTTKELITDIDAFKADQERSEERGRKLMEAFEED